MGGKNLNLCLSKMWTDTNCPEELLFSHKKTEKCLFPDTLFFVISFQLIFNNTGHIAYKKAFIQYMNLFPFIGVYFVL